jgi:hypothetical protein
MRLLAWINQQLPPAAPTDIETILQMKRVSTCHTYLHHSVKQREIGSSHEETAVSAEVEKMMIIILVLYL